MSAHLDMHPVWSRPVGSERFRVARLARDTALSVPGVVGSDTGPMGLFITVGGGERLEGVICVPARDGGYELTLQLAGGPVSPVDLGERVRTAVARDAADAGIAIAPERIVVHVPRR